MLLIKSAQTKKFLKKLIHSYTFIVEDKINIQKIRSKILPRLKKYKVSRASLFGSVVRNEAIEKNDIDILVELPEDSSLLDLAGLKIELEEVLRKEVDVLTYNSLHPLLKDRISRIVQKKSKIDFSFILKGLRKKLNKIKGV